MVSPSIVSHASRTTVHAQAGAGANLSANQTPRRSRFPLRVQFADQKDRARVKADGEPSSMNMSMSLASPRSVIAHVQSMCSPDNAAATVAKAQSVHSGSGGSSPRGSLRGSVQGSIRDGSPVEPGSPVTFGHGYAAGGAPASPASYTYRGASPTLHGAEAGYEAGNLAVFPSPRKPSSMSWASAVLGPSQKGKGPLTSSFSPASSAHAHGGSQGVGVQMKMRGEEGSWRTRLRRVAAVPAFKSPLTPVLNPVVTRAQWEIVVRSAMIALVVSVIVVGALVAVPVPNVH